MHGDVVTTGRCCGVHGCQTVTVEHVSGGGLTASAELVNALMTEVSAVPTEGDAVVHATVQGQDAEVTAVMDGCYELSLEVSLVCETSAGQWEYLLVDEGEIVLIDGQKVMVLKDKNNN